MARKKVQEYDSKCLFRENPMRLTGINLQILSAQPTIVSAHRTPERLYNFSLSAKERGFEVIIAGANGAAHLPGMVPSLTSVLVTGVPIKTSSLDGLDSLLSIVQGWWLH